MKKYLYGLLMTSAAGLATGCADNELEQYPLTKNYPFRLVVDTEEGGDLPDAEEYDLEITFADYIGTLPVSPITIQYEITDLEGHMEGAVVIDKIVYEVELMDCVYERELEFTGELTGIITIAPDPDLGTVPESFEIVFALPGLENTEGKFVFQMKELEGHDVILGAPVMFEYEVLDNDVAGEWVLKISSEEEFVNFMKIFAPLHAEGNELAFEDITGKITAEFEFDEMKFVIELAEEEEVVTCENGDTETELAHREIEIETEYDAEDGDLEFEGSHFIIGDDGEIDDEQDFSMDAAYELDETNKMVTFSFFRVVDQDNYEEGSELFMNEEGISFVFYRD